MHAFLEFFNFNDIGGKIKNFAKWSCWISILLAWISAVVSFFVLLSESREEFCWIPLVGAVVLSFFIWIGSWAMYAFGELVEDVHHMRSKGFSVIGNIDKNLQLMAEPMQREAAEKTMREAAKREAEILAKHEAAVQEAAEQAMHEAEMQAKREAEMRAKRDAAIREAEARMQSEAKESAKHEAKKGEMTLSDKLAYALKFQTDDGMIHYLQSIDNQGVNHILKQPKHLIRQLIIKMLENI